MKSVVSIILVLSLVACNNVKYVSKPVLQNPNIGSDRSTKRIIIALGPKQVKDYHTDKCIDGIISHLEKYTSIQIIDIIKFTQKIDSAVLQEVKCDYNADGLLLLTDIYVDETIFEGCISFYRLSFMRNSIPSLLNIRLWFNIHTRWEYFDFNSKKAYKFYANNEQNINLHYKIDQNKNTERDIILQKGKVLVENGLLCSKKLVGY